MIEKITESTSRQNQMNNYISNSDNEFIDKEDESLIINSDKFNVIEYINKKYQNSSLYEINEELVNLSKLISKIQQESKKLINNHFTKYIECHNIMQRILQDMNNKSMREEITKRAEITLKKVEEKLEEIVMDVICDIKKKGYDERREYFSSKYENIFKLKKRLEENVNVFEKFVKIFSEAKKEFEQVKNSKIMCKKIEETNEIQKIFLSNVFEEIRNAKTSFEQACYFFKIYFKISDEKGNEKIESTLLVNYKEATVKIKEISYEYVEYLIVSLKRLVKHLKNIKMINDGIKHFFECLKRIMKEKGLRYIKFLIKRMISCEKEMELEKESKIFYENLLSNMKVDGFREITKNKTLEEVALIYFNYTELINKIEREKYDNRNNIEVIKQSEKERLREIIFEYIISYITVMKKRGYEYLRSEGYEILKAQKCLGGMESKLNKKLKIFLKNCRQDVIQNISQTLEKTIKQNNDIKSLIEILRIIDKTPEFYKNILFEINETIIKRPIICFFVYKLANCPKPELTKEEFKITEKLNYQFGFLLK